MGDEDRARSPGSTIAASELDEHMTILQHSQIEPDNQSSQLSKPEDQVSRGNTSASKPIISDMTEDEGAGTPSAVAHEGTPAASTSRKRKSEGPSGNSVNTSIYSGNKVRHLKKEDGEPLWRKDIQYDFLKAIFEDKTACFTNSYEPEIGKQTFADLYIDAMARSSKTSKILRDKLLSEHEPAKNMAMVCLLVNLGRMNTTLNFFPEMRAQLRTYHAIPSLQAHQDPNSYKQLQDAPRLKSILKGASEDRPEPNSLEKIKGVENPPRTNPVNLIFVLAQYAPKVTELHFPPPRDFYDLIMRTSLSSKSRARAFLWLMWFYLESDFTEEGAEENPFGAGVDYGTHVRNQGVPRLETLTEEQQALENVDTPEEIEYGQSKMRERKRIIEADQAAFQAEHGPPKRGPKPKLHLPPEDGASSPAMIMPRIRPSKYESDLDSTRSTPPPRGSMRGHSGLSSGLRRGPLRNYMAEASSPMAGLESAPPARRARPLTAHQLAVERNRNQRVDYILNRGMRKKHHQSRKQRKLEGAFFRSLNRIKKMEDPFEDSEGEESRQKSALPFRERGYGGLAQLESEDDDFGEEMASYAAAFRRIGRRLDRWDDQRDLHLGVVATTRTPRAKPETNGNETGRDNDETEDETPMVKADKTKSRRQLARNGEEGAEDEKNAADLGSENDDEQEEDLDDVDKTLLGIGGDETEEEGSDGGMDLD
ncbi:putative Ino eighty subunit 1 [Xylogone sp. PMI_703]|nr:putative Ino eighty subunit 1 [Xylogone sp. PMI_703]